jgi:hypothetical protein
MIPQNDVSKLPKSRAEAIASGDPKFFTGLSCKHGHIMPRYTSTSGCIGCLRPSLKRTRPIARNQFWPTAPFDVPRSLKTITPELAKFMTVKLLKAQVGWFAEWQASQRPALTLAELTATDKCNGTTLESFVAAGWTIPQLIDNGYAVVAAESSADECNSDAPVS